MQGRRLGAAVIPRHSLRSSPPRGRRPRGGPSVAWSPAGRGEVPTIGCGRGGRQLRGIAGIGRSPDRARPGSTMVALPGRVVSPMNFARWLHVLGVVVWVGGMFFAHMALRPAALALPPPQRLPLLAATLTRFVAWAGVAVVLILGSGAVLIVPAGRFPGRALARARDDGARRRDERDLRLHRGLPAAAPAGGRGGAPIGQVPAPRWRASASSWPSTWCWASSR